MSNFYSKEDRENVEKLNLILGMKHRSKPYDFNDIDDVKDAFMKTVAEFIDYHKYYMNVSSVLSDFDESLEYFDPVSWMSLHDDEVNGELLAIKVTKALNKVDGYLYKLSQRSEKKCRDFLVMILNQNSEFQKAVLGKAYLFDENLLDNIFEDSCDIDETYSIKESYDAFIKILDENLNGIE